MGGMLMTATVDGFLEVEEEAARLVEALAQLKRETESYHTARTALDSAGGSLAQLTENMSAFVQRADGVIETLRSIGTPELLAIQQQTRAQVNELSAELAETRRAQESVTSAQTEALQASIHAGQSQVGSAATGLRRLVFTVGGLLLLGEVVIAALVLLRGFS